MRRLGRRPNGGHVCSLCLRAHRLRMRPGRREAIPDPIREEVVSLGKRLADFFSAAFAGNSRLKYSVGRLLTAQLPPRPRPGGRPGCAMVSAAISLREELRRLHPERSHKEIWREIYRRVIPEYETLPVIERRASQDQLHRRVYWRLRARRRRQRGKSRIDLSVL